MPHDQERDRWREQQRAGNAGVIAEFRANGGEVAAPYPDPPPMLLLRTSAGPALAQQRYRLPVNLLTRFQPLPEASLRCLLLLLPSHSHLTPLTRTFLPVYQKHHAAAFHLRPPFNPTPPQVTLSIPATCLSCSRDRSRST